jgi:hypothetical protein
MLFVSVSVYAATVKQQQTLRAGEVELTLYPNGRMEWYDGAKVLQGTYSLDTSQYRITIKETDGSLVGVFRYTKPSTRDATWVATIDFKDGLVLRQGVSRN